MSDRRPFRRTLWVAVCLGSVLTAGALPAVSARAAPTSPELVKGASLPYRVAFLPEPSPEPKYSYGADVTEAGTLLAGTTFTQAKDPSEETSQSGNGLYLTSRSGGVKSLDISSLEGENVLGLKPLKVNRSGTVLAQYISLVPSLPSRSSKYVVQWRVPSSQPETVIETGVMSGDHEALALNDEGAILSVHTRFHYMPRAVTHVIGGGRQERSFTEGYEEITGQSLAEEGTVTGTILAFEKVGTQPEAYAPVRRPFVAEGGTERMTILDTPSGVSSSVPYDSFVKTFVAPDGDWILGVLGSQAVSWDADRKPSRLGQPGAVYPVNITDGGRALVWSSYGLAVLKGKVASPLSVSGVPVGGSLKDVTYMNAAGQISATVKLADGRTKAALLEPVR